MKFTFKAKLSNTNYRTSKVKRTAAYLLSFLIVTNPVVPALGAILPDNVIESDFESGHIYQPSDTAEYQYKTPEYMEWSTPEAMSLESVYHELRDFDADKVGGAKFIPIGLDGITTFVPLYKQFDYIGTQAAQNRYIRTQIVALIRRNLINSSVYQTESMQLNELYSNAIDYAKSTDYNFGDQLNLDQENSGLDFDMIWPEQRRINNQDVVVPIVYLSSETYSSRVVESNTVEVGNYSAEGNVTFKNTDIRFARESFMGVAGSLRVENSTVSGDDALRIVAQGHFDNVSSVVETKGNLTIGALSINNETIVYRYDVDGEQGTRYGGIAEINVLEQGTLVLRSYSDINFLGASASAEGDLLLGADGNIYIGPQQIFEQHTSKFGSGSETRTTVDYLQSHLSAKGVLELMAGGEIVIDAARLSSDTGHISLLGELGISVIDAEGVVHSEAKGSFGSTDVTETTYQTIAIRSVLDAGDGVIIHSPQGDITIRAADISSQTGTNVKAANGKVNLLMTVENDHYSYNSVKESLFTITNVSRGHTIDNPVPNTIVGGLAVEALYGVTVEYEGNPDFNLREQVNNLSENPELSWMADVMNASDLDVNWEEMELVYEEWNERNTSLSPAAVALITIIVAVYTGNPDASNWLQAAMNAGSSAMMTQEVLAFTEIFLLNGGGIGDIDDFYKRVYSDEALTSAAVAMVTAGALHSLDAEFFMGMSDEFSNTVEGVESLSLLGQAAQVTTHSLVSAAIRLAPEGDFGDIDSLLGSMIMQNAVNQLGEHMAQKIGLAFDSEEAGAIETAMLYITHAASGCLVGVASAAAGDGTVEVEGNQTAETDLESACLASGGGAVVGEFIARSYRSSDEFVEAKQGLERAREENAGLIVGLEARYGRAGAIEILEGETAIPYYLNQLNALRDQGVDLARLGAGTAAFLAGANAAGVDLAASAGANAAEHNTFMDYANLRVWGAIFDVSREEIYEILSDPNGIYERALVAAGNGVIDFAVDEYEKQEILQATNLLKNAFGEVFPAWSVHNPDMDPLIAAGIIAGLLELGRPVGILLDMELRAHASLEQLVLDGEVDPALMAASGERVVDGLSKSYEQLMQVVDDPELLAESIESMIIAVGSEDPRAIAEAARLGTILAVGTYVGYQLSQVRVLNRLDTSRDRLSDTDADMDAVDSLVTAKLPGPRLPTDVAKTFSGSIYINRLLNKDVIFYKYHGIDNRTGWKISWVTNSKYPNEAELRSDLAIRVDWGVDITSVSTFKVPRGTWVSEGTAAAQGVGYPGGGYQAVISNLPRSWVIKTEKAFEL